MFVKRVLGAAALALLLSLPASAATPVGSAFTYQGMLRNSGALAQGSHDFVFRLYDDPSAGAQIGTDQTVLGVSVTNGFFSVALDFGATAFDGNARWLDIQVRVAGGGSYTQLLPRQPLRAAPYAVRAMNGASQWTTDPGGISYNSGNVGLGVTANSTYKLWINNGSQASNGLYITSNYAPGPALFLRNFGTNGLGLWDDTSYRHYLGGRLGLGTGAADYPLDVLNPNGGGVRITATGTTSSSGYPGEGVRAALFVHGNTGSASSGGIFAGSTDARGVAGVSVNDWGVSGDNWGAGTYGVLGTPNEGVLGYSPVTGKPAGRFIAPVGGVAIDASGQVKAKSVQILGGSDLAEPFDVASAGRTAAEPGVVVVIDDARPGRMKVSDRAYDTRVAGVVSGAKNLAPGMVMKAEGSSEADGDHPVALTGRVWCKVDASYGAVRPGDLLTSSPTPGHAMVASDPARRAGATIGKAMTSLEAGRGLVLVLVSLQ